MPEVFIASDHRGFKLKQFLARKNPSFSDLGPHTFVPDDDYNDAALAVARRVREVPDSFGILICGSAIGMSIQANRFKGIRAAIVPDVKTARLTRAHNDANVLCLPADLLPPKKALKIVSAFLKTPFSSEERHVRRVKRLDKEV